MRVMWIYVPDRDRKYIFCLLICLLSAGSSNACPIECECRAETVTCSNRGLTHVPRDIPEATEKLDLQGNNITQIGRTDLSGLTHLRKLLINQNRISFVHQDAFEDLTSLRTLHLDSNRITCIHQDTFSSLRNLEVLTMNNNLLTGLLEDSLAQQTVLRTFRLHSNPLRCDCHLSWLVNWLQLRPNMAIFTQCDTPLALRGVNLAAAPAAEFSCNQLTALSRPTCERLSCPPQCSCSDGIVDCRDRGLTTFPLSFPSDVTEIRLEQNLIEIVPAHAFLAYPNLQRIRGIANLVEAMSHLNSLPLISKGVLSDMSNNAIREIEKNAFEGLSQLTSLVMYSNKITSLPKGIFEDLRQLQLLLLNANKLKCLREDVFDGLSSLQLLSLYDNKLQSIARGTFDSLSSIQTLHLAQNPIICDCNLRWLSKFLKKHPVETSGARCVGPHRMSGKKIELIKPKRFRCQSGSNGARLSNECVPEAECPSNCRCDGNTVDCSGQSLTAMPDNIPPYAAELILSNNQIEVITNSMAFKKLRNLKKIDLSNNQINAIEDGAFAGATSVVSLWLNNNLLTDIRSSMFSGLNNLKTLTLRNNRLTCIGNHTFAGLSTVTHLSLYSNQINTVLSGAFTSMTSLRTLNLLSNPLNCNCYLSWLSTWLRRSPISSGNPRCEEPRFVRGFPVADINPNDFRCSPEETLQSAPTCLPVRKCPESCSCEGTVVRCGSRGLSSIPIDDMPHDVTELYLEMNSISEIPATINHFIYLTTLDLSNNRISSLTGWMFSNLTRLSTLILSYNRLRCIPPRAFAGLRSLRILSLHSNDISTLPEGVFDDLVSLSNVGFGANPWYCDCNLRWFARWVKAGNLEAGIARCSGPQRMEGRLILSSSLESFRCRGPLDMAIAVKCNPCLSSPCQHNSICSIHATDYYQCSCLSGFKGRHCEMALDPCILQPCQNGGVCRARDEVVYSCECPLGFKGVHCETNIDDCISNPCTPTNATCVDGINQFSCHCPSGWEGDNCDQRRRDVCSSQAPCQNGATCVPLLGIDASSYRCECSSGYRGVNCSQRFDSCLNHKCENGGICEINEDSPIGYQCNCIGEYSGQYCTSSPGYVVNILRDDPCSQHDCLNGAECFIQSDQSGYQCRCLIGYSGTKCEKLLSLSFHSNGSFVEMTSSVGEMQKTNISLIFSTTKTEGVILYTGDSKKSEEYFALELFSGYLRLSFNLGKYPGSTVYSQIPINDGRPHKVEILIQDGMVSLRIDDRKALTEDTGPGNLGILNVQSSLFVGGLSSSNMLEALRMWQIRNGTSFIGCIDGLFINGVSIDFVDMLPDGSDITHDVRPGCVRDGQLGSCSAARCDYGQCVYISGRGVECRCQEGYSGERCDQRDVTRSPCQRHSCQNGTCIEKGESYNCKCNAGYGGKYCSEEDRCSGVDCGKGTCVTTSGSYRCKCKKNYVGKHCETRIRQCRGKKVRQYHRSTQRSKAAFGSTTNCQSRRVLTNLVCNASCPRRRSQSPRVAFLQLDAAASSCCRPIRTVQKKIRMVCDDGTEMRQVIHRVRRCGCQPCT